MKNDAITIRIAAPLKRRLAARARLERRSLSAQAAHEIARAVAEDADVPREVTRPVLGRFAGVRVPTESDFEHVRRTMWERLSRRNERA